MGFPRGLSCQIFFLAKTDRQTHRIELYIVRCIRTRTPDVPKRRILHKGIKTLDRAGEDLKELAQHYRIWDELKEMKKTAMFVKVLKLDRWKSKKVIER